MNPTYLRSLNPDLIVGGYPVLYLKHLASNAEFCFYHGRFDEALQNYDYIIDVYPFIDILTYKADLLLKMERYNESLQLYNHIIELDPTNINVHGNRADILERMGDLSGALQEYNYVIKKGRSGYRLYRADLLVKMGRFNEALQDYNYMEGTGNLDKGRRAYLYSLMGKFDEAIRDYNTILSHRPNDIYIRQRRDYLLNQLAQNQISQ